jgi:hypothetical protein
MLAFIFILIVSRHNSDLPLEIFKFIFKYIIFILKNIKVNLIFSLGLAPDRAMSTFGLYCLGVLADRIAASYVLIGRCKGGQACKSRAFIRALLQTS